MARVSTSVKKIDHQIIHTRLEMAATVSGSSGGFHRRLEMAATVSDSRGFPSSSLSIHELSPLTLPV
jgi:hypothetical protein